MTYSNSSSWSPPLQPAPRQPESSNGGLSRSLALRWYGSVDSVTGTSVVSTSPTQAPSSAGSSVTGRRMRAVGFIEGASRGKRRDGAGRPAGSSAPSWFTASQRLQELDQGALLL